MYFTCTSIVLQCTLRRRVLYVLSMYSIVLFQRRCSAFALHSFAGARSGGGVASFCALAASPLAPRPRVVAQRLTVCTHGCTVHLGPRLPARIAWLPIRPWSGYLATPSRPSAGPTLLLDYKVTTVYTYKWFSSAFLLEGYIYSTVHLQSGHQCIAVFRLPRCRWGRS
jgi:hypothetical protein